MGIYTEEGRIYFIKDEQYKNDFQYFNDEEYVNGYLYRVSYINGYKFAYLTDFGILILSIIITCLVMLIIFLISYSIN